MILLLSAGGEDAALLAELGRQQPAWSGQVDRPGLVVARPPSGIPSTAPAFAFVRQGLPDAEFVAAPSVGAWVREVVDRMMVRLPDERPWRLQVGAFYGAKPRERMGARAWHSATRWTRDRPTDSAPAAPEVAAHAGRFRCQLIEEGVRDRLKERRRHRLKVQVVDPVPFGPDEGLVQVLLVGPDRGWISILPAPGRGEWHRILSPFPWGEVPVAVDKAAPSRAFAKLVEAEQRLGRTIGPGETCVDLGASPGSWTYVAVQRGARVTAVDRSPLRTDLMEHSRVEFVSGDAFRFRPKRAVDWLLCDVIAAPDRSIDLLLEWLGEGLMRRFVVSIKLRGPGDHPALERLKRELPRWCDDWRVLQLSANKGEVCAFGCRRDAPSPIFP